MTKNSGCISLNMDLSLFVLNDHTVGQFFNCTQYRLCCFTLKRGIEKFLTTPIAPQQELHSTMTHAAVTIVKDRQHCVDFEVGAGGRGIVMIFTVVAGAYPDPFGIRY